MFQSLWRRASRSVLIVSENPSAPMFDSEFLRRPDIRLLTTFPDEGAFEMVRRERPCLIMEDLDPPGHAGLALCRELAGHASTRAIPLILVTSDELWHAAHEARADVVLGKPLELHDLFHAVRRFIDLPTRRTRRVLINLRFTYSLDGRIAQVFSRDLSSQGAFLKTDRLHPLGTRLGLKFCIPGVADRVECNGLVRCTCSTRRGGEVGGIGIEFEGLTERDRAMLESFIDQHR